MDIFDANEHPHRRHNPLTGEYVLVSPHRTKRPWQGQVEHPQVARLPEYEPSCYLCPGNARSGGLQNPPYQGTFTFSNDFPALLHPPSPPTPAPPHPLLQAEPVHGACDVVIFHPQHDLTLARLSVQHIIGIIKEWTEVYKKRSHDKGVGYVQIFENKGSMMGCSNPHPHGQVWSLSAVPTIPSQELLNLQLYSQSALSIESSAPKSSSGLPHMLLEYAHFEITQETDSRVVVKNEHWVAVVPFWAVWPFETLVLPYRRHITSLIDLSESEVETFAQVLSSLTIKYDNLFQTSFAYSMGIHQRPVAPSASDKEEYAQAHLHVHFVPPLLRSASVRKFLVGFELMAEAQRDLTPEQAASKLRAQSDEHYLSKV